MQARDAAVTLLAAAALLGTFHCWRVPGVFYSTDSAVNLFVLDPPTIAMPRTALERDLFPLQGTSARPPPHNFLYADARGRPRSTYPVTFPWLCWPFFRLFGFSGLYVLPALGAGLAALAAAGLAGSAPRRGAFVSLCATPLAFYGLLFWGHSLGAAMVLGALALWSAGRPRAAGLLAGASALVRSELLLAGPALLVSAAGCWPVPPERRAALGRLAAGVAAGACLVACVNLATTGTLAGTHLTRNLPVTFAGSAGSPGFMNNWTERVLHVLWAYVGQNQRMAWPVNVALVAPLGALFAAGLLLPARSPAMGALAGLACAAGAALAAFCVLVPGQYATGMLAVSPVLALAGVGFREAREKGDAPAVLAGRFAFLTCLCAALMAPPGGWQWGPRYLLPEVVLLAMLAMHAGKTYPRTLRLLLAASVLCQAGAVRDLGAHRQALGEVASLAREAPAIATDVWFLPYQIWPSLAADRTLFVRGPGALGDVCATLSGRGLSRAVLIAGGREAREVLAKYAPAARAAGWELAPLATYRLPTDDVLQALTLVSTRKSR
ncbi:MAG: hypothetical protein HY303_00070 [Candidatus Wallbacteria bacterium]|nr:hypothetical protein [Candidatus Wallbacteria bacterium]